MRTGKKIVAIALAFAMLLGCVEAIPTAVEAAENSVLTLYDSHTTGAWYHIWNSDFGQDTEEHYIKIVETGKEDIGALHIVNTSAVTDMQVSVCLPESVPAGTYTLQMWVKGSVTYSDQTFAFKTEGDDTNRFDITGQAAYEDWTKVSGSFTTNGGTYFAVNVSKYNWATDFYIDNYDRSKGCLSGTYDL